MQRGLQARKRPDAIPSRQLPEKHLGIAVPEAFAALKKFRQSAEYCRAHKGRRRPLGRARMGRVRPGGPFAAMVYQAVFVAVTTEEAARERFVKRSPGRSAKGSGLGRSAFRRCLAALGILRRSAAAAPHRSTCSIKSRRSMRLARPHVRRRRTQPTRPSGDPRRAQDPTSLNEERPGLRAVEDDRAGLSGLDRVGSYVGP